MCYEFVYTCQNHLIEEITKLFGAERYFFLCFGHLNYFYCNDTGSIQGLFVLLESKGVMLHEIEELDLMELMDSGFMRANHVFHGDPVLFNKFLEKSEVS